MSHYILLNIDAQWIKFYLSIYLGPQDREKNRAAEGSWAQG